MTNYESTANSEKTITKFKKLFFVFLFVIVIKLFLSFIVFDS